jgi:hypothetical protein
VGAILRTLARTGFRRGLGERGGRGWLTIALVTSLLQRSRRKKDEPKVSFNEELKPGETVTITHYAKGERPSP